MSTDKLDKHTLSFLGRHTLEGQHEHTVQPGSATSRNPPGRKGGRGGPKRPEEGKGHAHKPWHSACSLGL